MTTRSRGSRSDVAEGVKLLQEDLRQAGLLLQFPPGGLLQRLVHVDEPARQGPLAGEGLQVPLDQGHLQVLFVQAEDHAIDRQGRRGDIRRCRAWDVS